MSNTSECVPLKDLCDDWKQDIVSGPFGSNLKREHYKDAGIPVLKIQNIKPLRLEVKNLNFVSEEKATELRRHSFKKGDIVVTKLGSPLGAAAIVDAMEAGIIVADLVRIRATKANTKYLCYHINSPGSNAVLNGQQEGATRPRVKLGALRDLPIYLPPLPEQERIVAILDEAFAAIATATANAEKNLANARELFDAKLNRVFEEKGEHWQESTFVDLCNRITVGHVGSMKSHYCPNGVSFLRSQNIRPFAVDTANLRFIDSDFESTLTKSRLHPGDVAIVRTGYPGTAAVIPEWLGEANCSDLVIVQPGPNIDSHFVAAFFNSPIGRKMVSGELVGAAQKHFNVTAAKQVRFPYPSLVDQQKIVQSIHEVAEEVERLAKVFEDKRNAISDLKQSLLHKAFTGELTADSKAADRSLSEAGV